METSTLEALLEVTASNIAETAFVALVSGIDVRMYRHIVDNYALLHTLRKHGNHVREIARGQYAVSPETFHFIPAIIANFDSISYELLKNRHTLIYEKEIGERRYFYIAEIRIGRKKQICAQTLWVRKAKKPPR